MLIVTIMLLSACAPSGAGSDSFCAVAKPIYIEDADMFTEATAREILAHNLTGEKICGW